MKITGFDELSKTLDQAQRALESLEEQMGAVSFNPEDPASLEQAIQEMEAMVDARLDQYSSHPIVAQLAQAMKEQYRSAILNRAEEARLQANSSESSDDV